MLSRSKYLRWNHRAPCLIPREEQQQLQRGGGLRHWAGSSSPCSCCHLDVHVAAAQLHLCLQSSLRILH